MKGKISIGLEQNCKTIPAIIFCPLFFRFLFLITICFRWSWIPQLKSNANEEQSLFRILDLIFRLNYPQWVNRKTKLAIEFSTILVKINELDSWWSEKNYLILSRSHFAAILVFLVRWRLISNCSHLYIFD